MTDKHSADEAFEANMRNSGWPASKREFEKYELLALWRAACAYQQAADVEAVEDEAELPGPIPDDIWDLYQQLDREGLAEALRVVVRLTKREIKRRITGEKA